MPDQRSSTIESLDEPGSASAAAILRRRRVFYGLTTAAITLLMALAVIGGATDFDAVGVSSDRTSGAADGYELEVHHGTVTRGGLATPFDIELHRQGGFDDPITIGVTREYMSIWDENGFYPTPSAETTSGDWVLWEFDPPGGDTFRFSYDARIGPSEQSGADGSVALFEGNVPVVAVDFHTRVLP